MTSRRRSAASWRNSDNVSSTARQEKPPTISSRNSPPRWLAVAEIIGHPTADLDPSNRSHHDKTKAGAGGLGNPNALDPPRAGSSQLTYSSSRPQNRPHLT